MLYFLHQEPVDHRKLFQHNESEETGSSRYLLFQFRLGSHSRFAIPPHLGRLTRFSACIPQDSTSTVFTKAIFHWLLIFTVKHQGVAVTARLELHHCSIFRREAGTKKKKRVSRYWLASIEILNGLAHERHRVRPESVDWLLARYAYVACLRLILCAARGKL